MKRGEIYYADLNPATGSEKGGIRPVMIIQNDTGNRHSPTVIVAPLTTRKKNRLPTHVDICAEKGISHDSTVLLEQIRTIDKTRIKSFACVASEDVVRQVDDAIKISLHTESGKEEKVDALMSVNYESEQPTISARELHSALGIEKRFSAWFETNSQGFIEGEDFTSVLSGTVVNNGAHRDLQDYDLSVDMAKHICLMSRTERGKQCRQYLIDLEKAWNMPEQVMARALKLADKTIESLKSENTALQDSVNRMKPKEIFADAVAASDDAILIGELAKIIKQNGREIGQNRMFQWLRKNGYLISRSGYDYNMPTQRSMEMKLFRIKERTINNPDGSVRITKTVLVTGKGQQYFVNKFMNNDLPEAM